MDRYKFLLRKNKPVLAYRFKPSTNSITVFDYMEKCILDKKIFDISNIHDAIVDMAVTRATSEFSAPLLVGSKRTANLLTITQKCKDIYTVETLPEKYLNVICYWDLDMDSLSKGLIPILILRKVPGIKSI